MPSEARDEISQNNQRFAEAFNKQDAATLASLYTADATIMPPGQPMTRGRQEIEAFWRNAFNLMKDPTLETVSVENLGGDTVREIGTLMARAGDAQINGKYVVLWKREGDQLRIDTDIWNSDT